MPRLLPPLVALLALLFATPLSAQDGPPPDPIVGTWVGIEMGGEAMPEDDFFITFNADGSGAFTERGDDPDPFTYAHDPEVKKICTIYIEDEEPFSFEVAFDGDTVMFTPTEEDGPPPLKLRRVTDADDGEDAPAPPMPEEGEHDTSVVGTWVGLTMSGDPLEEGDFVLTFKDDGTGSIMEGGDKEPEPFTYTYDADTQRCVIYFNGDDDDSFPIDVTFDGDTATFAPENEDDVLVARRVGAGEDDDGEGEGIGGGPMPGGERAPLVGAWEGVSSNGEPIDPDDSVRIVFHADGTGDVYEEADDAEPFTWTYDADAEACTIVSDGDEMQFLVSIDGDTMTFESEEMEMFLVMRRLPADGEDGMDGADGEDGADGQDAVGRGGADAEYPDGVAGVWYAQRMEGDWVPAGDEFRIEFRADGTAVAFENGEQEDDVVRYAVDEDRRVIQIMQDGGELEVELRYDLFDDIMVLTFMPPDGFEDAFEEGEMEILLSRRPEGNEEHQRMRAGADGGHPATGGNARGRAQRTQSMSNLRELSVCLFAYFADHDHAPESLGAAFEYLQDEQVYFTAWQDIATPDDWDKLGLEDRAAWLDGQTGYGYIGGEAASPLFIGEGEIGPDEAVVLFELPLFAETELISVAFADGHVESLDYDAADALIEEQTGRDLMGWMDHLGREQWPVEDHSAEGHGDHDHD